MESVNPLALFDPDFCINEFFNNMPVRIVGSVECPMFYAEDLATILHIRRVDNVIRNYDELEVITGEQRRKHNIVTYRDNGKKYNTRTLLTLGGAVKMISNTQNEQSYELRRWLYQLVGEISAKEKVPIKIINETLLKRNRELVKQNMMLKLAQEQFDLSSEQVYVFKITRDRYHIDDNGLHSDDEDSADAILRERFDEESTIDDVDAYEAAVKLYPALDVPDYRYKITANPSTSDLTKYQPVYKTYCNCAEKTIKNTSKYLQRDLIDCADGNIFESQLDTIIETLNRFKLS